VWISSFSAGAAVGPLAGGALLERFWWGSVFLLAVPVMALLLVLGPLLLPEYRDEAAGRLDLRSAAMSLAAVLLVIWGLKQLAQDGFGLPPALSILAGLAVGVVFVRRQRRLADPLLDLRLFRSPAFSAALAANTLDFFVAFAAFLFIAQYLQLVVGLSPLRAGLWMLPSSAGFIVGSLLTPLLVRRARPAYVMAAGMAVAAVGFGSVVFSLGSAPMTTLATDLMVGTAPPERSGAASGISETSSELGGALGIAVLGSIAVASDGFTQGVRLSFAISAAVAIGIAILVVTLLRHAGTGSEPEARPEPGQDGSCCAGKVGVVNVSKAAPAGAREA
jgi:DHA2 family multidrug resistance protein-like MFS transporter